MPNTCFESPSPQHCQTDLLKLRFMNLLPINLQILHIWLKGLWIILLTSPVVISPVHTKRWRIDRHRSSISSTIKRGRDTRHRLLSLLRVAKVDNVGINAGVDDCLILRASDYYRVVWCETHIFECSIGTHCINNFVINDIKLVNRRGHPKTEKFSFKVLL